MNYNQLIADKNTPGSVASWLNNSTIQQDVPDIILEAESWIYRRLRHWRMLSPPIPGTMNIGDDSIPMPSDMLEPYMFWFTGNYLQNIQQRTPQDVIGNWAYAADGTRVRQQPLMYYFDQEALRLDSPADRTYPYMLIYYQQPAALAPSNATNFLTDVNTRLLRCCVMAAATEWTKESGTGTIDRMYWDQMSQMELEAAQQESDRAKRATNAGAMIIGDGLSSNLGGAWLY